MPVADTRVETAGDYLNSSSSVRTAPLKQEPTVCNLQYTTQKIPRVFPGHSTCTAFGSYCKHWCCDVPSCSCVSSFSSQPCLKHSKRKQADLENSSDSWSRLWCPFLLFCKVNKHVCFCEWKPSWRTDTVGRFLVFSTHLHDLLFCIFPISNSKGNPGRVACQNGHTLDFLISMFYRGEADTRGLVGVTHVAVCSLHLSDWSTEALQSQALCWLQTLWHCRPS